MPKTDSPTLEDLPHPDIWRWHWCPEQHDVPRAIPGWWALCPEHSRIDWKRVEAEADRRRAGYEA